MSAALWLHDRKIPFEWFERSGRMGGTLHRVGNVIDELIGCPPLTGPELASHFAQQLRARGLTPSFHTEIAAIHRGQSEWELTLHHIDDTNGERAAQKRTRHVDAVIVATGTRPRMLDLPGEQELLERGVEISVNRRRDAYRGKKVAVIGGGDAALEGALLLAEVTEEVLLIHRRDRYRAQTRFDDAVRQHPRIRRIQGEVGAYRVDTATEQPRLRGVTLTDGQSFELDGVFVRLGVVPTFPSGILETTAQNGSPLPDDGFSRVVPGIYTAGDVSATWYQSVSWCAGSAARAVTTLCHDDLPIRDRSALQTGQDG